MECKQPSLALDLQRINENDKESKFSIFGEESRSAKETAHKMYEQIKLPLTHNTQEDSENVKNEHIPLYLSP